MKNLAMLSNYTHKFMFLLLLLAFIVGCNDSNWSKTTLIPEIPRVSHTIMTDKEFQEEANKLRQCTENIENLDLPECN